MNNIDRIAALIDSGKNNFRRIGLELEHFVCDRDYHVISYPEMASCLEEAGQTFRGKPFKDQDNILGLFCDGFSLSLGPGCQLEISISPMENMEKIRRIYQYFRQVCDPIFAARGFYLLEKGVFPLIENGELEPDMLPLTTASAQVSIDFSSEEDALRKMRVLIKLSPVVSLLTEHKNGLGRSERWRPYLIRNQIWQDVDPVRGGSAADHYGEREIDAVEHVLSMYFPMVRLKKYIEYRVADSMPIEEALGYAAFIKTLVYDEELLRQLDLELAGIQNAAAVCQAENSVIALGYRAEVYGKPVLEWMDRLFRAALQGACGEDLPYIRRFMPLPLLNDQYKKLVAGAESLHRESAADIRAYLLSSTAKYHDRVVRTLYLPKLFTEKETAVFEQTVNTLYFIFDKVIAEYEKNETYRRMFGFPEELEELILRRPKYRCNIPIARIDLFYNEETGDFKFCEFNTDGTSAMNEDRELNTAFEQSRAYREFRKDHNLSKFELFDTWVEEALTLYREYADDGAALPSVAIVDFMEHATTNEFLIFRERFEKKGCTAVLCDIRKLTWDGKHCYSEDGTKIDLIYRRAVTSDILAHYDEVGNFLRAVRANSVCLLGDFRTQIIHNKILFKLLHKQETLRLLSKEEQTFIRAHVPLTISLDEVEQSEYAWVKEDACSEKNRWILKPEDSYGSQGVHAGVELPDQDSFNRLLEELRGKHYILQQFTSPYRLDNIDLSAEDAKWADTGNLTGLFVYNGKFSGIYSRISFDQMISTQYNEMSLPTVIVK